MGTFSEYHWGVVFLIVIFVALVALHHHNKKHENRKSGLSTPRTTSVDTKSNKIKNGKRWAGVVAVLIGFWLVPQALFVIDDINKLMALLVPWTVFTVILCAIAYWLGSYIGANGAEIESVKRPNQERTYEASANHVQNIDLKTSSSATEDKTTLTPSDFDVEDDFEKLLQYSSKIEAIYSAISKLPRSLKRKFREGLYKSKDPISDAERLAKSLLAEYSKSLNPFDSEEANRCYRLCNERYGGDAAKEFEAVYKRLGPSADPAEVLEKVSKKYAVRDWQIWHWLPPAG